MTGAQLLSAPASVRVFMCLHCAAGFEVMSRSSGRDAERTARRAERLDVVVRARHCADALALPGVEAVTIAAPPAAHAALAMEACEAGRHVICEKPFKLDVSEAEAMVGGGKRSLA